jgi:hypothetical protein
MAIFHVQQGSASFVVNGPVALYASGSEQIPAPIAAGDLFAVETGNTAVFARNNPAIVTNTGSEELLLLAGYGYEHSPIPGAVKPYKDYSEWPWVTDSGLNPIAGNTVDVSFEQVVLEPGALTHIDSNPDERLVGWFPEHASTTVRMMRGEHNTLSDNPLESFVVQSFVMDHFSPGPYTFFNAGEYPVTIHLMRIVPAGDVSSDTATSATLYTLNLTTDP